jgi:glycosyltransferase involved in cell wall biosynthesis
MRISYFGYFTPFGGYGIANFNWVKHLLRQGVEVFPHGKFMPKLGEKEWDILNEEEIAIAQIPYQRERIGIIETTPFDFGTIDTEIKIANTMAESDIMGKPWVDACNGMDYLVVPNEFQKKVFLDSGVTKPVKIIPHGTETEKFPFYDRPKRDTFTFGIAGWLDTRKGVFDVIQAFASEFSPEEPVRLLLKSTNPAFGYYSFFSDNRITTINTLYSPSQLNEFYQSLDCFVFPSKAEGIGQPPREAMSTGLPVILTNYSGLEDIAKEDISYPLQPASFTNRTDWVEQPGRWANIDIQELMFQMRHVYEHGAEARNKGNLASYYIQQNFSWKTAARQMKEFLLTL